MNLIERLNGFLRKSRRSRLDRQAREEAYRLDRQGQYAEAAAVYTRMAQEYPQDNPLIYQLYAHDSFAMWLKAKKPQEAQAQAGDVLRLLADTGWLERSSDAVDDLSKMVGELYVSGYQQEAAELSAEINRQLVAHGLHARAVSSVSSNPGMFPATCPQCGGALPAAEGVDELKCPYCGSIVRSVA